MHFKHLLCTLYDSNECIVSILVHNLTFTLLYGLGGGGHGAIAKHVRAWHIPLGETVEALEDA